MAAWAAREILYGAQTRPLGSSTKIKERCENADVPPAAFPPAALMVAPEQEHSH
jgi:hypothetical protein